LDPAGFSATLVAVSSPILYPFEDVGDGMSLLPLAARRALDAVGLRLSLEGYRSLSAGDRRELAALGSDEVVDVPAVDRLVKKSALPASRIKPVADPDPRNPPEQLASTLGSRYTVDPIVWSRLRALDRYALVHVMRRSIAHDDPARLDDAAAALLPRAQRREGTSRKGEARPAPPAPKRAAPRTPGAGAWSEAGSSPARLELDNPRTPPGFDDPWELDNPRTEPPSRASHVPPTVESEQPATERPIVFRPSPSVPPRSQPPLAHLDESGNARMVDVGDKEITQRRATASGIVRMGAETAQRLAHGDTPKGDVLAAARIAGIMAAKRTHELVPLCHPIALTKVEVQLEIDAGGAVVVSALTEARDRTGVEMEALTAVSVACLTIYDMLKGIDRDMEIGDIHLASKSGGRTGTYVRKG